MSVLQTTRKVCALRKKYFCHFSEVHRYSRSKYKHIENAQKLPAMSNFAFVSNLCRAKRAKKLQPRMKMTDLADWPNLYAIQR